MFKWSNVLFTLRIFLTFSTHVCCCCCFSSFCKFIGIISIEFYSHNFTQWMCVSVCLCMYVSCCPPIHCPLDIPLLPARFRLSFYAHKAQKAKIHISIQPKFIVITHSNPPNISAQPTWWWAYYNSYVLFLFFLFFFCCMYM